MSVINDADLISQGALQSPGKLGAEVEKLVAAFEKLLESARKSQSAIDIAKTTSKVAKETQNLTRVNKELVTQQEKAAKIAKVLWLSENEVAESQKRAAKETRENTRALTDLEKKMVEAAKRNVELGNSQKKATEGAQAADKAYKAEAGSLEALTQKKIQLQNANKLQAAYQKEDARLLKEGLIGRGEFNKRVTESTSTIQRNNVAIQSLNGAIKNHILTTGQIAGEYKKLSLALESARTKYKDMAASGTATTAQLKAQQQVFEGLNNKVIAIDKTMGQFQRNVGNYPTTFGLAAQAVTRFMAAFGIVGGLFLFAKAIKDVIALTSQFELKNSTLQAVLGETKEGIKQLTAQQLAFGEATIYSALQVADAQIIFSKAGLKTDEIKAATEATLDLATATGEDLAKSADVVTTTMRAFGLEADQTTRIVDVMTGAFNKTTLGLENYFEALKYVAPVAKANNISLEETTALLGTLADAGIRGSSAGTALRKIMSELDKGTGTLSEKLLKLSTTTFNAADAQDEVGRTAYASLLVLKENAAATTQLETALHDVSGAAKEAAAIMADNLIGDTRLLTNATQSLVLAYRDSFNGALRSIVQGLTQFVFIIRDLPKFLKENRALILALVVALVAFKGAAIQANAQALLLQLNMVRMRAAALAAATTMRAFGASLVAALGPLGLVLIAVAALIAAVDTYDRNSARAVEVQKERNALNEGLASGIEKVNKAQKDLNYTTEQWLKMSEEQKKSAAEQIEFVVKDMQVRIRRLEIQKIELEQDAKQLTVWQQLKAGVVGYFAIANGAMLSATYSQENAAEATEGYNDKIKELKDGVEGLTHILDDNNKAVKQNTQYQSEAAKKAAQNALKAQLELDKFRLQNQIKLLEEIQNNENNSEQERLEAAMLAEKKRRDLAGVEQRYARLGKIKGDADLVQIDEEYQAKLTENAVKGSKDRDAIRKQALEKEIKIAEEQAKIITERILSEEQRRLDGQIALIQNEVLARRMSREKADKEIAKLQAKSDQEIQRLTIQRLQEMLNAERTIYFEGRKKLIEDSRMSDVDKEAALIKLKQESAAEQIEIDKKIHDAKVALNDSLYENQTKLYEKEIETLTKVQAAYQTWGQALMGIFSAIAARRIQDLDDQMAKDQEYFDNQIELAGDNDDAKKEIEKAAESRRQELERQKRQEQRKAAIYEKAQAIVSAGIQTALAVLNALSTVHPYPVAVIAAASAGVLGAIQIAAIAAQPLPAYAEGVASGVHPGGAALVSDGGGPELVRHNGKEWLTPATPSVVNLPQGAEVIPYGNQETMRALALDGLMRSLFHDRQQQDHGTEKLLGELKGIKQAIKAGQKSSSDNFEASAHNLIRWTQAKDNMRSAIREHNLGKWD